MDERNEKYVIAPFNTEQVQSLNEYQAMGAMHPFTCGNDGCPGKAAGNSSLVATRRGWVCPSCRYTQAWAWRWMADGSWRELEDTVTKDEQVREGAGVGVGSDKDNHADTIRLLKWVRGKRVGAFWHVIGSELSYKRWHTDDTEVLLQPACGKNYGWVDDGKVEIRTGGMPPVGVICPQCRWIWSLVETGKPYRSKEAG